MLTSILPIFLIVLGGYAVGRIFALIFKSNKKGFFVLLLHGNILINFIFVSFFILLGVLTSNAQIFFFFFGIFLLFLLFVDLFYLIMFLRKKIIIVRDEGTNPIKLFTNNYLKKSHDISFISILLVVITLIVFNFILISQHSIYNEYDSLYIFLPISQSIILGDGLNIDFFGGSDDSIKYPPFIQAFNAWIIDSFDYQVLRSFPFYFVLLTSLSIYFIAKRITEEKFLPLVATSFYLLTPATLVIFSRFSLQHDIAFLAFLTFSALSFYNLIYSTKIKKYDFLMFIVAISILPLTREIGLIISWSLLLVLIAFKFTNSNKSFKIVLTILSFAPIYALTFYDLGKDGLTNTTGLRLLSLLLCNSALIYLSFRFKRALNIRSLYHLAPLLIIVIIPSIFIFTNLIQMSGPYPTLMFSSEFNNSIQEYRYVFDVTLKHSQSIIDSILQLPRIDLLFISTALGSSLLLFKITGFINILKNINHKFDRYSFLLIFVIILLLIWSYFLSSNFKESGIRHIGYFIPFMSIIAIIAFQSPTKLTKLYILIVIAVLCYFVLNFEIKITYLDHYFNAVWIDPFVSEISTFGSLIVGILLFVGYLVIVQLQEKFAIRANWLENSKYIDLLFLSCCLIIISIVVSINLGYSSMDLIIGNNIDTPPPQWENNVTEVTNYLQKAEDGNVLSIRTPSISFLTNRTNYDAFNPHTFGKIILPILKAPNSTFEEKIKSLGIKYIIIPNEKNPQYDVVKNIDNKYNFTKKLENPNSFAKIKLPSYDIYKNVKSDSHSIDIFNKSFNWSPLNVEMIRSNSTLLMLSDVITKDVSYNRVFLNTNLQEKSPLFLYLNYSSEILKGNASFIFEVRNLTNDKILYMDDLGNTNETNSYKSLLLPTIALNNEIQLRFYIIPHEPGKYYLVLNQGIVHPF